MDWITLFFRVIVPGIALGLILGWVVDRRPEYWKKLDPRSWSWDWDPETALKVGVICSVIIAGVFLAEVWIGQLVREAGAKTMEESNYATQMFNFSAILFFAAITIQPIFEEWIFRGVFLEEIKRQLGNRWIAIILSGVFFAVAHLFNTGVLPAALLQFA
ncbi:MAG: lysostaphin resistance A-like protein, partial [Candidatus Aenigmatarchaeota archaeon]